MPNPINIKELIADREVPGVESWAVDGPSHNQIVWSGTDDRVCFLSHSDGKNNNADYAKGRRIARLPDLEAVYIEAVEVLRDMIEEEDIGVDLYQRARKFLGDTE